MLLLITTYKGYFLFGGDFYAIKFYAGGRFAKHVSPALLKGLVIAFGGVLSLVYFVRVFGG